MSGDKKGVIFNVQKYNVYDGPGVRTLVFFKGCPLRCKWCSNPEGLEQKYDVLFKSDNCTNCGACVSACPVGIHSMKNGKHEVNRSIDCIGCHKCEEVCIPDALSIAGELKTVSELLEIIEEDVPFYDMSGGGVTLGGGEVTMQAEFATELLKACKEEGINTAIETCGHIKQEKILKIAEFTDLFLYDLKHIDSEKHFELTGVPNETILSNLVELLSNGYNVKIRMPLLKGVNDSKADIEKTMDFLMSYGYYENFKGVDLLPYHRLGVSKYDQLEMRYTMEGDFELNNDDLEKIEGWIKQYDLNVTVIKH